MTLHQHIIGRLRLLLGNCPMCNSNPRKVGDCWVCKGRDQDAPMTRQHKDVFWIRYRAHVSGGLFNARDQGKGI